MTPLILIIFAAALLFSLALIYTAAYIAYHADKPEAESDRAKAAKRIEDEWRNG